MGYSLNGLFLFLDSFLTVVARLYRPYPAAQTAEQSSMT